MGKKLNVFACACLATLLASQVTAKKQGVVIDGRPTIQYKPPEAARNLDKPSARDIDEVLKRAAAAHRRIPGSELQRFKSHSGYKIVFDKQTNKLYVLRGARGIAVFPATRSSAEGDKKRAGDQRTPEGIFTSERPVTERTKGFVVWMGLNTAPRARGDYIALHGQRAQRAVQAFESRHGRISSDAEVQRFNKTHALPDTAMWTGIGIHGRITNEYSQTRGCISLDPRDALELQKIVREPVPVLITGRRQR